MNGEHPVESRLFGDRVPDVGVWPESASMAETTATNCPLTTGSVKMNRVIVKVGEEKLGSIVVIVTHPHHNGGGAEKRWHLFIADHHDQLVDRSLLSVQLDGGNKHSGYLVESECVQRLFVIARNELKAEAVVRERVRVAGRHHTHFRSRMAVLENLEQIGIVREHRSFVVHVRDPEYDGGKSG